MSLTSPALVMRARKSGAELWRFDVPMVCRTPATVQRMVRILSGTVQANGIAEHAFIDDSEFHYLYEPPEAVMP